MKTKPTEAKAVGRRDFLRKFAAGAVGGTAATTIAPFSGGEALAAESEDEKKKPRYNANSADVKNYYRVNRYPSR